MIESGYCFGLGLAAIASITVIELYALHQKVNGKVLSTVVAAVAGISGFAFGMGVN